MSDTPMDVYVNASLAEAECLPSTWVVIGPDPVLKEPYVLLHREGTDGTNYYDRRIERRKD